MDPVHMKRIPRLPYDRIEDDVSYGPHKEQLSLRLARLRGPLEASKLAETRDWMDAKKEARSENLSGLKGTVGSVEARDRGVLT